MRSIFFSKKKINLKKTFPNLKITANKIIKDVE